MLIDDEYGYQVKRLSKMMMMVMKHCMFCFANNNAKIIDQ